MNHVYFAKAFDQSAVAMAFLQGDGVILGANAALVQSLGKELWFVVGSALSDHFPTEERDRWIRYFDAIRARQGVPSGFECAYLTAGGERRWWDLHVSDLDLEWSGQPLYFAIVQDVTDRRRAEESLREARRQAEGASRAKSEFLANISHEIRTPLFTITGMTDLLRSGNLHKDQAQQVGQIATAAQHLLDLVNDVLDFSKIEAGHMHLESIPFDLDEVITQSLEVVSLGAERKDLDLILDLDPALPTLWRGDPSRLRQVLVNLLSNAVKFTSRGRVIVSAEPGLILRVSDTGIGMSPETVSTLFVPFTQADASTTRQYGGSGLGLAISRRLVSLMDGEIKASSVLGEGSEFMVRLPLQALGPPEPPLGGGKALLVAEDDELVEVLARRLDQAGFRVVLARTRGEALAWADEPWDAALIGPILGSREAGRLVSELRARPGSASRPVLLLGAPRNGAATLRYRPDLFHGVIHKPVNPRALVSRLVKGFTTGDWNPTSAPPSGPWSPLAYERRSSGLRVLVAEDHEVNRELFRMLLQSLGHDVLAVDNGRKAYRDAVNYQPHLILMDLQMPEMNGYEAARKLRSSGVTCPIVAVTASALDGEGERCRSAGMDGVLTKPFTRETLRSALEQWLGPPMGRGALTLATDGPDVDFDPAEAERIFLGNRTLLETVVERFRTSGAQLLVSIDQAAAEEDGASLNRAAHALKGSAANLTARRVARAAEALERASSGSPAHWPARIAELHERWEAFGRAVSQW